MKVVAFNGSPRKEGNTFQAIKIVADELEKEGIEVEIIHVGNKIIRGCLECYSCRKNQNEKCAIDDDVNNWIQKMKEADGILLGSPTHYASITGPMKSFLDRAFYVAGANKSLFRYKVGAAVVVARRTGGMVAFEQLNNYMNNSEMLIPTSYYWNVIRGGVPGEINEDEVGKKTLRSLGKNMAWLMKLVDYGKHKIKQPEREDKYSL